MEVPLHIAFRNMDHDPAIAEEIRRRADKLEEFCDRITSCTVTVEAPHQHHRQGNLYRVRIHLALPRHGEVVADRERGIDHAHEDVHVALRDAFKAARRQLQDAMRERQGATKQHMPLAPGWVARLFPDYRYGFIETPDGREVFFHSHSVVDHPFEELVAGDEVRFAEEQGDKGPQATVVHVVGKHHHIAP
jgi:cold shock CspA family protein/ribosome-associated translation inhibitor RaiA